LLPLARVLATMAGASSVCVYVIVLTLLVYISFLLCQ